MCTKSRSRPLEVRIVARAREYAAVQRLPRAARRRRRLLRRHRRRGGGGYSSRRRGADAIFLVLLGEPLEIRGARRGEVVDAVEVGLDAQPPEDVAITNAVEAIAYCLQRDSDGDVTGCTDPPSRQMIDAKL